MQKEKKVYLTYIYQKKSQNMIKNMYINQGYSPEEIAELTGLKITDVLTQLKFL
ncbi:hypothetical protein C1N66_33215 (plasmid) [Bacillus cereus]|uniref:Uncharacterized protein n=1 Tax=Bacillus cereus TaxID=1396 RepID=A0AB73VAN2_BACCE|nr:hypothetical protein [Bacillus cereus]QMT27570.1 hypothetical protein C1N66_33215 [Bacillus cereus]